MCNSRFGVCCRRKKQIWICSVIALAIIITVFILSRDLRTPETISMTFFAYAACVAIVCVKVKCNSKRWRQDAEPNDNPPNYEDVIAKAPPYENAIVEGVPRFPGAPVILTLGSGKAPDPSLCQGNRDSTLSATSNVTDSGLPSYNEALNQSFETKILLEGSSCASVHK